MRRRWAPRPRAGIAHTPSPFFPCLINFELITEMVFNSLQQRTFCYPSVRVTITGGRVGILSSESLFYFRVFEPGGVSFVQSLARRHAQQHNTSAMQQTLRHITTPGQTIKLCYAIPLHTQASEINGIKEEKVN